MTHLTLAAEPRRGVRRGAARPTPRASGRPFNKLVSIRLSTTRSPVSSRPWSAGEPAAASPSQARLRRSCSSGLAVALLALITSVFTPGRRRRAARLAPRPPAPAAAADRARAARNRPARRRDRVRRPGRSQQRRRRILGREPAPAPGQLRRARRRHVPDGDRDGRPAVHDAAADHLGRSVGDRLQARLRARRRPDRRAAAGDRPVVGARGQLGIPYEDGLWSGPVRIERPPQTRRRQCPRAEPPPGLRRR